MENLQTEQRNLGLDEAGSLGSRLAIPELPGYFKSPAGKTSGRKRMTGIRLGLK